VLGCTHYPLLKGVIAEGMGDVALIDSAVEVAKVAARLLAGSDRLRLEGTGAARRFYVTDSPQKFVTVGERFLAEKIGEIEKVALSEP
jgi:glutamate racemase